MHVLSADIIPHLLTIFLCMPFSIIKKSDRLPHALIGVQKSNSNILDVVSLSNGIKQHDQHIGS